MLRAVHGPSLSADQDSTEAQSELCEDGAWARAEWLEGMGIRGTEVSEQRDSQTPALHHPSSFTKLREQKPPPPSKNASSFLASPLEGSLSEL